MKPKPHHFTLVAAVRVRQIVEAEENKPKVPRSIPYLRTAPYWERKDEATFGAGRN